MKKLTKLLFAGVLAIALTPVLVSSLSKEQKALETRADPEIVEVDNYYDFMEAMKNADIAKVQLNETDQKINKYNGTGYHNAVDVFGDKELILNGSSCFIDYISEGQFIYNSLLRIDTGNSLKITGNGSLTYMTINNDPKHDNSVIRVNGGSLEIDGEDISIIGDTSFNTYCRAITLGSGNMTIKNGYFDGMNANKQQVASAHNGTIHVNGGTFAIHDGTFTYSEGNGDQGQKSGLVIGGGTGSISGGHFNRVFMYGDLNLADYIDPICTVHNNQAGFANASTMNYFAEHYNFDVLRPNYNIQMSMHHEAKFGSPYRVDYTLNFVPDVVELYQLVDNEWILVQDDFNTTFGYVNAVSYEGNKEWDRIQYRLKPIKHASFGDLFVTKDFQIEWKNTVVNFYPGEGTGDSFKLYPNMTTKKITLPAFSFTAPENKVFDKWKINGKYYNPGEEVTVLSDTNVLATYREPKNVFTLEPKTTVQDRTEVMYVVSFDGDFYNPSYAIERKDSGEWVELTRELYQGTHFRVWNEDGMVENVLTYRIVAHNSTNDAVLATTEQFDVIWKNPDSAVKYSLTYHAGETSALPGNEVITINNIIGGDEVYAADCPFTAPDNKVFIGWAVDDVDEDASIDPSKRFPITHNTVLYAKYDYGYDVTIESGESEDSDEIIEHVYGTFVIPECEFGAPANKRFSYWYTDQGNKHPGDEIFVDSSCSIIAIWEDILYTVSFKGNGGEGDMAPLVDVSGAIPCPNCTFEAPDHFEFIGWAVDGPTDVVYPADYEGTIDITDNIVLHAKWANILHTITYNAGEAGIIDGNTSIVLEEQGEGSTIKLLNGLTYTAPEGKVFKGWALNTESGTLLQADASYEITADATFIAIWENETKVTVSFNANGGSGTMDSITLRSGKYLIPTCDFIAPEGKEFLNWQISGVDYNENDVIVLNQNTEIKALWKDKAPEGGGQGGGSETPTTPDTTTPDTPQESAQPKGLSGGAIAGIVIGSTVVVGLGGFAVFWFVIKKKTFADLLAIFSKK